MKIIKIVLLAILILLAWAPGPPESYNPSGSAYALATDRFAGSSLSSKWQECDFLVYWAPFGRLVKGCGAIYYVNFLGAFLIYVEG